MYVHFAEEAREEGFTELADLFDRIGAIEKTHEARYLKLLENIKEGKVWKADGMTIWKCRNCGYIHTSQDAPDICPACNHPQSFFEIEAKNY
jgi:rubrerythrin